jgi:hypothetical protein
MANFDEMLLDEEVRQEYDRRVSQELESARADWENESRRSIEAAVAEWNRQASLTEDERLAERIKALDERERAITVMELRARAAQMLTARGLPAQLAEVMSFEDAAACDRGVEMLDRAFREAVQAEVIRKIGGEKPVMGVLGTDYAAMNDEQYYSAVMMKRG